MDNERIEKKEIIEKLNKHIVIEVYSLFTNTCYRFISTMYFDRDSVMNIYENAIEEFVNEHKITDEIIQQLKDIIDSEVDFLIEESERITLSEISGFCDNYIFNSDLERRIKEMVEN